MKTIVEYIDYRDFLKDFYEDKKRNNSFFSYRIFGKKVGMDASLLVKVLSKSRHIGSKIIANFIEYLNLKGNEAEYFENLVHFTKSKSDKQSKLYFDKMLSLRDVKKRTLDEYQYEFYQKWYYSAVRLAIECFEFRGDYKELAEQLSPPITIKEAKKSIHLLKRLKLIEQDSTGKYVLTDSTVSTGDHWRSIAIRTYQEKTIKLSHESLERHAKEIRDISTITMGITSENFEDIREKLKEFRASIIKYVDESSDPDNVYQLNMQLIPLTQIDGKKDENEK
jgi:uncharacterized protein (TIGR02147 family)